LTNDSGADRVRPGGATVRAASQLPHFAIALHNLGNSAAARRRLVKGGGNAIDEGRLWKAYL